MAAETVGFSGETRAVRETTARHSSETSKITSMVRRPCLIFWAENRPFFTLSQMERLMPIAARLTRMRATAHPTRPYSSISRVRYAVTNT